MARYNNYPQDIYSRVERPIGVIIIAILIYIVGVVVLINGFVGLVIGVEFLNYLNQFSRILDLRIGGELIISLSLFLIGLAIFDFILGTALLKLRNWARVTVIVLNSILAVLFFVLLIISIKIISATTIPFMILLISFGLLIWIIIYLSTSGVRFAFSSGNGTYKHRDIFEEQEQFVNNESGYLLALDGRVKGKRFDLFEGRNIIGRSTECDIYIPDPEKYISRKHAVIICKENFVGIKNLSDKNSTYVNSKKIQKLKLKTNDIIRIGKVRLKYQDRL